LRVAWRTPVKVRSEVSGGRLRITVGLPPIEERRVSDLEGILRRFLDGHEVSLRRGSSS
jgi:hypothetical protein